MFNEEHDDWEKQCPCDKCRSFTSLCHGNCEDFINWLNCEPSEEDEDE